MKGHEVKPAACLGFYHDHRYLGRDVDCSFAGVVTHVSSQKPADAVREGARP